MLVGADVAASPSPAMMNAAFAHLGLDARYEARSVSPESFRAEFGAMTRLDVKGLNITMPYKVAVLNLLDRLDDISARLGAVNTVVRGEEGYVGHNTDVAGIVAPLASVRKRVKSALLIGAGGAARAFCCAMDVAGCRSITVVARNPERAERFLKEMREGFPAIDFGLKAIDGDLDGDFELIFNATPVGSNGTPLPEGLARALREGSVVFDAVYLPSDTELTSLGRRRGCKVIPGTEMLLHQAFASFKVWTGKEAPHDVMRRAMMTSLGGRK